MASAAIERYESLIPGINLSNHTLNWANNHPAQFYPPTYNSLLICEVNSFISKEGERGKPYHSPKQKMNAETELVIKSSERLDYLHFEFA